MFPVTRDYVGTLVPDIGETTILNLETNHALLHPSPPNANAPTRNRLMPAVNTFDFPIWWGAPIPTIAWNEPAKTETQWLNMRTRPSAVLRTVLIAESRLRKRNDSDAVLRCRYSVSDC